MKTIKNNHSNADQSTTEKSVSHKHDANVQKNTTLYFQVGLILCLLGAHLLFEMQFETTITNYDTAQVADDNFEAPPEIFKVYVEPVKDPEPVKKEKKVITDKLKVVDDKHKEIVSKLITQDQNTTTKKPVDIGDVDPVDVDPPMPEIFDMTDVEKVPVYPGCERKKTNSDKRQCMSDKLSKLIQRKFNTDLAEEYGLSGIQKIDVQFKIDKTGRVTDILTRAPHPVLEKEAKRVTLKIPVMEPGLQRGTPVSVMYNLPIKFKVQD